MVGHLLETQLDLARLSPRVATRVRGFSLIEVTVALALMALVMGVVLPSLNSVGVSELFRTAGELGGLMRESFDTAALSGRPRRLLFDFKSNSITVEEQSSQVGFSGTSAAVQAAGESLSQASGNPVPYLGELDFAAELDGIGLDADDALGGGGLAAALFGMGEAFSGAGGRFSKVGDGPRLDDDLHILDLWLSGMKKPVAEGQHALIFWQSGHSSDAIVHLESRSNPDTVVSVVLYGLSGRVEVASGYRDSGELW